MSPENDQYSPREFGELVGLVKSIHENTKDLPDLKKVVTEHGVRLDGLKWFSRVTVGAFLTGAVAWLFTVFKGH